MNFLVAMLLMMLLVVFGVSDAYFAYPDKHNKAEEWSNELDISPDDITWPKHGPKQENGEIYHWVENDVVEKQRTDENDLLHLPGGCELTQDQYQRLQEFRRDADYVQNCYCQDGGVYCKLRKTGTHVQIT